MSLEKNISRLLSRKDEIEERLSSSSLDTADLMHLSKELSDLRPIAEQAAKVQKLKMELSDAENLVKDQDADAEMVALAEDEIQEIRPKITEEEYQLKLLLLPKDKDDSRNAILEIRAGTGGDEAALFGADLFGMYQKFASQQGWRFEVMEISETGIGGYKEATANISGQEVFAKLKFESGVHRVQRVADTETGGRIHTSAATVAVLPEAEKAELDINEATDIKVDTYRASGAGGQHVNKTESAIRLTHIPTGLVVTCQDQASQHKNKASALKVMRARLFALEQEKLNKDRDEMRKSLVSTGDRSAKIRTYNFPQGRITDHRINYTTHKLQVTLEGDLDHIIEQLKLAEDNSKIN